VNHLRIRSRTARAVSIDWLKLATLGFIALLVVAMTATLARSQNRPDSFADLAERLRPAVVNISTSQSAAPTQQSQRPQQGQRRPDQPQAPPGSPFEDLFRDLPGNPGQQPNRQRRGQSVGSGFVIDAKGFIVTNLHVIAEGDTITVTFEDNRSLPAKVVGKDPKTDLAVLKVESEKPLAFVRWGDSDAARVGDWVLAIGNPFGLGGSVSAGIISARGRNIEQGPYDNFLQTDAAINRGNSGGPMFNMKGEVVGINTAIFSPPGAGGSVGVGFAIPANLARTTVSQLIDFGRTRRGWLGVQIQSVTDDIAESLQLDGAKGALVSRLNKDGPADKAGVEQSDVILRFDGKPVAEMRALPRIVAETPIDKEVDVVVWRKGKEVRLKVKVGELVETETASLTTEEPAPSRQSSSEILGMALSTITPELRRQFEIKEGTQGVVITSIGDASPAAEKGVRPGDVIVEVNQEAVKSPAEIDAKVKAVQKAGRKSVLFLVERGGELRFVAVRLEG
jgi:serine protease Do